MQPVVLDDVRELKGFVGRELMLRIGSVSTTNESSTLPKPPKTGNGFISIVSEQARNHRTARRSLTDF